MTCRFCPNCGFDIEAYDKPITVGRLTITETGTIRDGRWPVYLSAEQNRILRTIALAYPRPVGIDALILRHNKQELEDPENLIRVQVVKIRQALGLSGLPLNTLKTVWGRGYALSADPVQVAA